MVFQKIFLSEIISLKSLILYRGSINNSWFLLEIAIFLGIQPTYDIYFQFCLSEEVSIFCKAQTWAEKPGQIQWWTPDKIQFREKKPQKEKVIEERIERKEIRIQIPILEIIIQIHGEQWRKNSWYRLTRLVLLLARVVIISRTWEPSLMVSFQHFVRFFKYINVGCRDNAGL